MGGVVAFSAIDYCRLSAASMCILYMRRTHCLPLSAAHIICVCVLLIVKVVAVYLAMALLHDHIISHSVSLKYKVNQES